jgi:hypothetical protein
MTDFLYNDSEVQMDSSLILCIEEHDNEQNVDSVDNRIFIGYDIRDNDYYVRGKRQDTQKSNYVPYAFHCDLESELYDFIEFVVGGIRDNISIVLYNFNNISNESTDDLTYEFFEEQMDRDYEIAAYDRVELNRDVMIKNLKMLKNMYNWESR